MQLEGTGRYVEGVLRLLQFVENRRPTGRRFGADADARWASFRGDLETVDRIELMIRDAVRQFVEAAFSLAGLDWAKHVEIDPRYFRPTEVDELRGDAAKAGRVLGWQARTTFEQLVRLMLEADLREAGLDPTEHLASTTASA